MLTNKQLEDVKAIAEKHGEIPHNFICQDDSQKTQVYYWNATNPSFVSALIEEVLESRKVICFYSGDDDSEGSWMEPDEHLMYWTLWSDGDCVGGERASAHLKKFVSEE